MNTCNNCDCVLSESDLTIEIETDDENYYLCIDCTDNKSDDEKIIAVWKFGTSVGIDEDDEFDVNDYKDHMFVDEEEEEWIHGCDTCGYDLDPNNLMQKYNDPSVYQCDECYDKDKEKDEKSIGICNDCNEELVDGYYWSRPDRNLMFCADCGEWVLEEEKKEEEEEKCVCGECGISTKGRKIRGLWDNKLCEECGEHSDVEEEDEDMTYCSTCDCALTEDVHIFCFEKDGEEDLTMCSDCADDTTDEMRTDGWKRDDDV